ncbi:MAG: rod-binding protein [Bdellovibrionales bacterium]|nr:rod-binding protein [Bdellovibrionales bacterium]
MASNIGDVLSKLPQSDLSMIRLQQQQNQLESLASEGKKGAEGAGKAEQASKDFEAMLVQQMFRSMWKTVPQNGILTQSREEQLFQEMLQDEVAKNMSESQSIGIKDVILRELREREGE